MTISEGDYLVSVNSTDGDLVAHKVSPAASTDDYVIVRQTTDNDLAAMKVSPVTKEDEIGIIARATDQKDVLVKGTGLVDVCTVLLRDLIPKGETGIGADASPTAAGVAAFTALKAKATWGGGFAVTQLSFWDSPAGGGLFDCTKAAKLMVGQSLTADQVNCITNEATTARVELITVANDFASVWLGDVTVVPIRINLSLSDTTYAGPSAMYAAASEGSAKAVDSGTIIAGGDQYRRGVTTYNNIDISQFSAVTTSDKIRLWHGIDSGEVAPIVQRPTEPWRYALTGPIKFLTLGGSSNPLLDSKIVFQKPE